MPILVQICIAIATLAIVVVTVMLIPALGQVRKTAAQVERTMFRAVNSPAIGSNMW